MTWQSSHVAPRSRRCSTRKSSASFEASLASLDERHARRWVDAIARAYELALLLEAGELAVAERLRARPLGLLPGAKLPSS